MKTRRSLAILTLLAFFGLVLSLFSGCGGAAADPWAGTTKPRIVTSIVPLHSFAANIAEPDAEVRCLLITKGPHDFQPTPYDAKLLSSANLFIVNGLKLEGFLDRVVKGSGNRNVKIVNTGENIPKNLRIHVDAVHHGDHSHPAGDDPHVWLGIDTAKYQVEAIRDALCEVDPKNANNYKERAEAFLTKLESLRAKGADLKGLPGGLVTFHDSFRYFGRSFDIPIAGAIRGLQGEEISPAELKEQAQEFKQKGVRIIGVEPQYPSKAATELARAIDPDKKLIQIVPLDPLETGEPAPGRDFYVDKDWYLQKMTENLEKLSEARKAMQP